MKWIDIKKRKPVYNVLKVNQGEYIVAGVEDGEYFVTWAEAHAYGKNEEHPFSQPGWSKMNVTHWTILPKHPKK